MKDRCVFLNSFGEKEISRLVRWILFMKLNRQERKEELVDKLFIRPRDAREFRVLCQEKQVILLDDIFTTGSTASACARIIKENGWDNCSHIYGGNNVNCSICCR